MSSCPDKFLIELFVLGGVTDAAEVVRIRSHLAECPFCGPAAEEAGAFHALAGSIPSEQVDRVVRRVLSGTAVGTAVGGRVLELEPVSLPGYSSGRTLLAADHGTAGRFEPVQTYANVEADLVARLLRDNASRVLSLYLVESGGEPATDRVLEIEGQEEQYAADDTGRVELQGLTEEKLKGRTLRIRTSIAVFDLAPVQDLRERIRFEGHYALRNAEFDEIRIETEEAEGRMLTRIRVEKIHGAGATAVVGVSVSRRGDSPLTSPVVRGAAVFEELDPERILKIRIY
ncbi:MAG: hypothetical protein QUS35_01440 [bacterium]|nr:hypothetical protein [bacterium]